jgi:uncharacterized low-complexity protein
MKKITTIAVGTAFAATMASGVANAVENPFGMTELQTGYNVAMSSMEGACGAKDGEGKCGEGKDKAKDADKAKEAKCGEGKCGGK